MGRRHGKILESLGDSVEYVDIGYDPTRQPPKADSILVCTPSASHACYLAAFKDSRIPIFVEKPVIVPGQEAQAPETSLVACNWRWGGVSGARDIVSAYHSSDNGAWLDLIHFVDLLWEERGRPDDGSMNHFHGRYFLAMRWGEERAAIALDYDEVNPRTVIDGKFMNPSADMFVDQMRHWRDCVCGKTRSCNSVKTAVERTSWLIAVHERDVAGIEPRRIAAHG